MNWKHFAVYAIRLKRRKVDALSKASREGKEQQNRNQIKFFHELHFLSVHFGNRKVQFQNQQLIAFLNSDKMLVLGLNIRNKLVVSRRSQKLIIEIQKINELCKIIFIQVDNIIVNINA